MLIKKKALLYDISNIAFTIADTGNDLDHTLHRVRDICEEGNIDRVARILGLAFTRVAVILGPLIHPVDLDVDKDWSYIPRNYELNFKMDLSYEKLLKIKETVHEYMVSLVLADWLSITYPQVSSLWNIRAEDTLSSLSEVVAEIISQGSSCTLTRKISPF